MEVTRRQSEKQKEGARREKVQVTHRHKFRVVAWQGDEVEFRCPCGERRQREMSRAELRRHRGEWGKPPADLDVHRVWHDFQRRFLTRADKWRWSGYALMTRVERWARQYPDDARIVNVDDDAFAGSHLVLVEHRARDRYMGTTAVFIPQCTGEPPARFFLYPHHLFSLARALRAIRRAAAPLERRERAQQAANARWWAARPVESKPARRRQ